MNALARTFAIVGLTGTYLGAMFLVIALLPDLLAGYVAGIAMVGLYWLMERIDKAVKR